ncbi:MAG: hypothetical protein KGI28_03635 [Thaumarchaeota archaeon]|nr:hypothetical protein [Nitrososphaerota archaeon]
MNKKVLIGIAIVAIASAIAVVGLKGTLGDKAVGLPGEDKVENTLNIQEKNTSSSASPQPNTPSTSEAKESGP